MKLQNSNTFLFLTLFFSLWTCTSSSEVENKDISGLEKLPMRIRCPGEKHLKVFDAGEIICATQTLNHPSGVTLKIHYIILNPESEDPYEQGYYVLQKSSNERVLQSIPLRKEDEPAWSQTPFVRIRKDAYFSDLDNDGFDEFAVFPFSPGSALIGTVTIYSLKDKIVPWGTGRISIEGDGHVLLGCPQCSKFNPKACDLCY